MPKIKISISYAQHRAQDIVKIAFERNASVQQIIRKLPEVHWSQSLHTWYQKRQSFQIEEMRSLLFGLADIEIAAPEESKNCTGSVPESKVEQVSLSAEHDGALHTFEYWMRSRRYAESTIGTYIEALRVFFRFFIDRPHSTLGNADLIEFNNRYILHQQLSASYQNQIVNAVKLFYKIEEHRQMDVDLIHRPKRQKQLPNVLSKEEVKLLLNCLVNVKHKLMLSLIYSCGLRRGELLQLRLRDIDYKRRMIFIHQAKGRKDRMVPLSEKIALMIEQYLQGYRPKEWLFEGQGGGQPYDERSLGNVLQQALQRSGINKPVTLHWLRHSYATHLLESGTDLRYIQTLLGHSRSTTTEIYTHVSNHSLQRITSPFDSL